MKKNREGGGEKRRTRRGDGRRERKRETTAIGEHVRAYEAVDA